MFGLFKRLRATPATPAPAVTRPWSTSWTPPAPLAVIATPAPTATAFPSVAPSSPAILPAAVRDAIDGASVNVSVRAYNEDEGPRVIVTFAGWQPFVVTDDGVRAMLGKMFPEELSEPQIKLAMRRLDYRAAAAITGASASQIDDGSFMRSSKIGGVAPSWRWDAEKP